MWQSLSCPKPRTIQLKVTLLVPPWPHPNLIALASQSWAKTEAQAEEEVACGLSALESAVGSDEADYGAFTSYISFTSKVDCYELRGD